MMGIEQEPFRKYNEEKSRDTFTVSLNEEERRTLEECKKIMEQPKDSTALKQLAWIGAKVIHEEKVEYLLGTLFKNKRKNKRLGIIEFEV